MKPSSLGFSGFPTFHDNEHSSLKPVSYDLAIPFGSSAKKITSPKKKFCSIWNHLLSAYNKRGYCFHHPRVFSRPPIPPEESGGKRGRMETLRKKHRKNPVISPEELLALVSKTSQIPTSLILDIKNRKIKRSVTTARKVLVYLLLLDAGLPNKELQEFMGYKVNVKRGYKYLGSQSYRYINSAHALAEKNDGNQIAKLVAEIRAQYPEVQYSKAA